MTYSCSKATQSQSHLSLLQLVIEIVFEQALEQTASSCGVVLLLVDHLVLNRLHLQQVLHLVGQKPIGDLILYYHSEFAIAA